MERQSSFTSAISFDEEEPFHHSPYDDANDIICAGSDAEQTQEEVDKKRLRYERQARNCAEGHIPTIQSATLRGPFNRESGWVNPWRYRPKINPEDEDWWHPGSKDMMFTRANVMKRAAAHGMGYLSPAEALAWCKDAANKEAKAKQEHKMPEGTLQSSDHDSSSECEDDTDGIQGSQTPNRSEQHQSTLSDPASVCSSARSNESTFSHYNNTPGTDRNTDGRNEDETVNSSAWSLTRSAKRPVETQWLKGSYVSKRARWERPPLSTPTPLSNVLGAKTPPKRQNSSHKMDLEQGVPSAYTSANLLVTSSRNLVPQRIRKLKSQKRMSLRRSSSSIVNCTGVSEEQDCKMYAPQMECLEDAEEIDELHEDSQGTSSSYTSSRSSGVRKKSSPIEITDRTLSDLEPDDLVVVSPHKTPKSSIHSEDNRLSPTPRSKTGFKLNTLHESPRKTVPKRSRKISPGYSFVTEVAVSSKDLEKFEYRKKRTTQRDHLNTSKQTRRRSGIETAPRKPVFSTPIQALRGGGSEDRDEDRNSEDEHAGLGTQFGQKSGAIELMRTISPRKPRHGRTSNGDQVYRTTDNGRPPSEQASKTEKTPKNTHIASSPRSSTGHIAYLTSTSPKTMVHKNLGSFRAGDAGSEREESNDSPSHMMLDASWDRPDHKSHPSSTLCAERDELDESRTSETALLVQSSSPVVASESLGGITILNDSKLSWHSYDSAQPGVPLPLQYSSLKSPQVVGQPAAHQGSNNISTQSYNTTPTKLREVLWQPLALSPLDFSLDIGQLNMPTEATNAFQEQGGMKKVQAAVSQQYPSAEAESRVDSDTGGELTTPHSSNMKQSHSNDRTETVAARGQGAEHESSQPIMSYLPLDDLHSGSSSGRTSSPIQKPRNAAVDSCHEGEVAMTDEVALSESGDQADTAIPDVEYQQSKLKQYTNSQDNATPTRQVIPLEAEDEKCGSPFEGENGRGIVVDIPDDQHPALVMKIKTGEAKVDKEIEESSSVGEHPLSDTLIAELGEFGAGEIQMIKTPGAESRSDHEDKGPQSPWAIEKIDPLPAVVTSRESNDMNPPEQILLRLPSPREGVVPDENNAVLTLDWQPFHKPRTPDKASLVPSEDFMSPAPSPHHSDRDKGDIISTQILVEAATKNPWSSSVGQLLAGKSKKRVSFGVLSLEEEDLSKTEEANHYKFIPRSPPPGLYSPDHFASEDMLEDQPTTKYKFGKHFKATRQFRQILPDVITSQPMSSPALGGQAEAFIAADHETSTEPDVHRSSFSRHLKPRSNASDNRLRRDVDEEADYQPLSQSPNISPSPKPKARSHSTTVPEFDMEEAFADASAFLEDWSVEAELKNSSKEAGSGRKSPERDESTGYRRRKLFGLA